MNIQTDEDVREKHSDQSWITEHELYEEAENNVHAREVFPNPLMLEYMRDSGAFNNTEQKYIEKMDKFLEASQRVKVDDYEKLKDELKEDLRITESYNMFETVK